MNYDPHEHNHYERTSECCGAPMHSDIDVCTECGEWA